MMQLPSTRTKDSSPPGFQPDGGTSRETVRGLLSTLVGCALVATTPLGAQTAISASGEIESTSGGFKFPDGTVQTSAAGESAPVEVSGQEICYDPSGSTTDQIACDGTGQDGDLRAGVAWPDPRFTDNSDGTVTDHLTGLTWLEDADCSDFAAPFDFQAALSAANNLADGQCGLTDGSVAGDWRMPNIKELLSLVDHSQNAPALPSGHPFLAPSAPWYWSSTSGVGSDGQSAWGLDGETGDIAQDIKSSSNLVWPVRGESAGASAPAPVEDTAQQRCFDASGSTANEIDCTGTGQDGEKQAGVDWPAPRFRDNTDGTVTDRLTGLVWLQNGACSDFGGTLDFESALAAANNLADGQCGLTDGSVAGDWRLPNIKELHSLADHSERSPALPPAHPFIDVNGNFYWSSTSKSGSPADALTWRTFDAESDWDSKTSTMNVWPVRGPQ